MRNQSIAERSRVVRQYRDWLLAQPDLIDKARSELRGKVLACWCSPKPCHGHILAEIANSGPVGPPVDLRKEATTAKSDIEAPGFPDFVRTVGNDVDFYCVLDFEATCDNLGRIPKSESEIIEFPSVLIDVRKGAKKASVVAEFQRYCKPVSHPQVYPFCTELTGITQSMVENGVDFQQALKDHSHWLASFLSGPDGAPLYTAMIVTCGSWDLDICLLTQLDILGMSMVDVPNVYHQWINIKKTFQGVTHKSGCGMKGMLREMGLPLVGRHHSGIDDTRNISNLLLHLLWCGATPEPNISKWSEVAHSATAARAKKINMFDLEKSGPDP